MNKNKITIIGAGESGVGAGILAKKKGFEVFISDKNLIADEFKDSLIQHGLNWEEGQHSIDSILNAMEVIKSPGIPDNADVIQKVIENNYWLFGEQYHLASSDKNLEVALSNYLTIIEKGEKIPIKIDDKKKLKRPDIFICKQIEVPDSTTNEYTIEENIIVELKRPSVIIGKEQFSQVEDYLRFIKNEPRFNSQLRKWKFIVIGKKVDDFIESKYESQKDKGKRYLVEGIKNYEIYAMTWDDIFRIFESRHKHLIDKLEFKNSIIEELEEKGIAFSLDTANELTKIAVNQ